MSRTAFDGELIQVVVEDWDGHEREIVEHPGAVAYGKHYPEFWVQIPIDGQSAQVANGIHFGFFAASSSMAIFWVAPVLASDSNSRTPPVAIS